MATDIEKLLEEIRSLPPEERHRLQEALEDVPAARAAMDKTSAEEEFKRRLLRAGLLKQIKPRVTDLAAYRQRRPFVIEGMPLSQPILEERR